MVQKYRKSKQEFAEKAAKCKEDEKAEFTRLRNFYFSSEMALVGIQRYLQNYAALADKRLSALNQFQKASREGMQTLRDNLLHITNEAPKNLAQALHLILSVYIALQVTGEPVSLGRLDYVLRNFCPTSADDEKAQELVDAFFLKIGEKVMFNRNFFDNHQYWGNIAMGGGGSGAYPQGASYSQWGQQITLGGTHPRSGKPFYSNLTVIFLRAGRRVPVNAPCLGLRVSKETPKFYLKEAAKALLSGGAQPIILNDDMIIPGLIKSGSYAEENSPFHKSWVASGNDVPFSKWKSAVDLEDARDYTSDGCHEYLIAGKTWFCISGGPLLTPLEYALNEGHEFGTSGPAFIHGKRGYYTFTSVDEYKSYEDLEEAYLKIFRNVYLQGANGHLGGYGNITNVCPAPLLNAFVHNSHEKGADLYQNGARYNIFAPQYSGMANLANAMWNIRKLVFKRKVIDLHELREIMIHNWGRNLVEPFISTYLPKMVKEDFVAKCDKIRTFVQNEPKFGLSKEVSDFGLGLATKINKLVYDFFANPIPQFLGTLKRLANSNTNERNKTFGFQITPGGATFENFEDAGAPLGASFDGRLKGQTLAQDFSPQNYLMDT